mmetsp:Transcript_42892/g.115445  ORF Transcript_42892/g.115445 Transcript_42892/m.115445 type:complete len:208 (+) Transcript_42892:1558-2181(+)
MVVRADFPTYRLADSSPHRGADGVAHPCADSLDPADTAAHPASDHPAALADTVECAHRVANDPGAVPAADECAFRVADHTRTVDAAYHSAPDSHPDVLSEPAPDDAALAGAEPGAQSRSDLHPDGAALATTEPGAQPRSDLHPDDFPGAYGHVHPNGQTDGASDAPANQCTFRRSHALALDSAPHAFAYHYANRHSDRASVAVTHYR